MTNVTSYRKQGVEISESKLSGKSRNGAAGYIYADCSNDIEMTLTMTGALAALKRGRSLL